MFNPITIIQSVWKWFVNAFSQLTSFSKLKFFLVTFFLFTIGWYYIKCYETPVFDAGFDMRFVHAEPKELPTIDLHYSFDHNNSHAKETNSYISFDSIYLRPTINADSSDSSIWFIYKEKTIDTRNSLYKNNKIECTKDTAMYGLAMDIHLPIKQPFFFKHSCEDALSDTSNNYSGLKHIRLYDHSYLTNSVLSISDVFYRNKIDSAFVISKNTLTFPLSCKPQWRCKGDLSTFIVEFFSSEVYNQIRDKELCFQYKSISFEFNDFIQILTMTPSPDSIWASGFAFTDPRSLELVHKNGIDGFGKFPRMEAWQLVRTFALTTLLATLISIFLGLLYDFIQRHSKIKSIVTIATATLIVCLVTLSVIYADYWNMQTAYQQNDFFVLIVHFALYLVMEGVLFLFMYELCQKYSINIWVYIIELIFFLLFMHAAQSLLMTKLYESERINLFTIASCICGVTIFLPTIRITYLRLLKKDYIFKRIYGRSFIKPYSGIWFTIPLLLFFLVLIISVVIVVRIGSMCNIVLDTLRIMSMLTIGWLVVSSIYLYTSKIIDKNKKDRLAWKGTVQESVTYQPFTFSFSIAFAIIYALAAKHRGVLDWETTMGYLFTLVLVCSPLWILPYIYKPSHTIRWLRLEQNNIKIKRRKFLKRLCRL